MESELTDPNENEPPSKQFPLWHDWKWQFKNRTPSENFIDPKVTQRFPCAVTPYYLSLIEKWDASDPIYKMCIPQAMELVEVMYDDPLSEDQMSPIKGLVHRYPDRALVIATTTCSVYCRYCTRKRKVGGKDYTLLGKDLEAIVQYLRDNPQIFDVIISGGDPLTLPTPKLEEIIAAIRGVKSVEIIRIGTKVPVVLPQRITEELVTMLRKYHPLFINTHFNHPREVTPEAIAACGKIIDAGIPMGNQSVLLRGINDDKLVQEELCRKLIKMRVRPYYLFQCDIVQGVEHFRTKVAKGIEIMEHLRGRLSGLAIPQYVIDSPGGKGKIPILPTYLISQSPDRVVLRNCEGAIIEYPEVK